MNPRQLALQVSERTSSADARAIRDMLTAAAEAMEGSVPAAATSAVPAAAGPAPAAPAVPAPVVAPRE
jgi:hypothetical protein